MCNTRCPFEETYTGECTREKCIWKQLENGEITVERIDEILGVE